MLEKDSLEIKILIVDVLKLKVVLHVRMPFMLVITVSSHRSRVKRNENKLN